MKHTINLTASYLRQLQLCIIPCFSSPSKVSSLPLYVHQPVHHAVNCQVVVSCRQGGNMMEWLSGKQAMALVQRLWQRQVPARQKTPHAY
jgi:hypothetical protein